jgi:hypothetical protein
MCVSTGALFEGRVRFRRHPAVHSTYTVPNEDPLGPLGQVNVERRVWAQVESYKLGRLQ